MCAQPQLHHGQHCPITALELSPATAPQPSPFTALPSASPPLPGAAAAVLENLHLKGRGRRVRVCNYPTCDARSIPARWHSMAWHGTTRHNSGWHSTEWQHSAIRAFLTARVSFDVIKKICCGCSCPQPACSAKENQGMVIAPKPLLTAHRCGGTWGCSSPNCSLTESPGPPAFPQQSQLPGANDNKALLGYTWCFNRCFLFDFLIFVFSEKALASSNSFLRVAGRKQASEGLTTNSPKSCQGCWGGDSYGQEPLVPEAATVVLGTKNQVLPLAEIQEAPGQRCWCFYPFIGTFVVFPTHGYPRPPQWVLASCSLSQAAQRTWVCFAMGEATVAGLRGKGEI